MDTSEPEVIKRRLREAWLTHPKDLGATSDAHAYIERLEERCAAYKGQVEYGAAETERLTELDANRTVQVIELLTERDALRQEIGRLKELLAPFAVEANEWGEAVPDDHKPIFVELGHWDARYYGSPAHFTVGDQRRARAALKQEPKT